MLSLLANDRLVQNLLLMHDGDEWKTMESLFDTLVEGKFNPHTRNAIKSEEHINLMFHVLFPRLSRSNQIIFVKRFGELIRERVSNAEACRRVSLLGHVVGLLKSAALNKDFSNAATADDELTALKADQQDHRRVIRELGSLIETMGTHSLGVSDLLQFFGPFRTLEASSPCDETALADVSESLNASSSLLLDAMTTIARRKEGPCVFFDLSCGPIRTEGRESPRRSPVVASEDVQTFGT